MDLTLYDHPSSICSQMARLALEEKGLTYARRTVDIMDTHEQFEPWYVALNPRAVVPTLTIGDEVVTDTIRIVGRVDQFDGPDLSGGPDLNDWLKRIMAPHYGVLLYRNRVGPDGTAPQITARGDLLRQLQAERPDLAELTSRRLAGNARLSAILKDPAQSTSFVDEVRTLARDMTRAVADSGFISGGRYSMADAFATATIARLTIHGFSDWWAGTALEDYYAAMKARPTFAAAGVIDTGTEADL